MLSSITKARVRPAQAQDAEALARVFAESWSEAYRGVIPHLHLQSMIGRRNAEWWRTALRNGETILALDISGQAGGYATLGPSRLRASSDGAQTPRHGSPAPSSGKAPSASKPSGKQSGEIYELYLAPTHQGLGLGELLFEGCRATLDARDLDGLLVWALAANTSARGFYWRRGGRPIARTYDRIGGAKLEKIAYGWS